MATSAKYQVFVSSTYEDLKDERDQVIRAVLEMGHIPVGMEMFSAADDQQWKIIARHIEESDYYAVIIAHRLGSLADGGLSYTRKEYEFAASKGIPILGFVLNDNASWPANRVDTSTGTKKALIEFKNLVKEKPVGFWSNAEDLYGKFLVALMKAITANPREGWVRASSAEGGPAVTAEVVRLSSENATLRQQLADAKAASVKDQLDLEQQTLQTMFDTTRKPSYRYEGDNAWQDDATVTLFDAFHWLGKELIVESDIRDMANTLAMHIRTDKDKQWNTVAHNQLRSLIADLMALDLVQPSKRKHPVTDDSEYWSLSSYGKSILKRMVKATFSNNTGGDNLVAEEDPEATIQEGEENAASATSDDKQ
ncbi:DUF4062 domain-containing protein [Arthrobacter glacialis]|uniref:DUF4062 domain-containing protein n=1 Tax=Arthrobacter glacialis TaxID=1664 RepID=UPI0013FE38B6|nr:DUF4062 domain-containing protein [Arthrobacter glacialis]